MERFGSFVALGFASLRELDSSFAAHRGMNLRDAGIDNQTAREALERSGGNLADAEGLLAKERLEAPPVVQRPRSRA